MSVHAQDKHLSQFERGYVIVEKKQEGSSLEQETMPPYDDVIDIVKGG